MPITPTTVPRCLRTNTYTLLGCACALAAALLAGCGSAPEADSDDNVMVANDDVEPGRPDPDVTVDSSAADLEDDFPSDESASGEPDQSQTVDPDLVDMMNELRSDEPDLTAESCDWEFVGEALTKNHDNRVPDQTLQVVLFYEGDPNSEPTLTIEMNGTDLVVGGDAPGGSISVSGEGIETREYRTSGCEIAGFRVDGTVPNGYVDGLAFGVLFKDQSGRYTMAKSTGTSTGAAFVGMWPLGMSDEGFAERTPQLDFFGRQSGRAIIWGAALVDDGKHGNR